MSPTVKARGLEKVTKNGKVAVKLEEGCDSQPSAQPTSQSLLRVTFILGSKLESDQLNIWKETKVVQLRF